LQKPLSSLNYIAAAVLAYNLFLAPSGAPARLPEPLFGLCSLGLGLLILSRVSSATERFSTARSLWADVVSTIRTSTAGSFRCRLYSASFVSRELLMSS
ncbi:unnamed protein product, partial [Symbiodinium microadriaticum]